MLTVAFVLVLLFSLGTTFYVGYLCGGGGEQPCMDCGHRQLWLIWKTDHHGGMKRVCADRDACHERSPG